MESRILTKMIKMKEKYNILNIFSCKAIYSEKSV